MTSNPYAKIKQNSVLTASPEELTLMLYNGAIKFANQGIEAIELGNPALAHEKIVRVQDIVEEFMASLNHDYAVAKDMELMYDYMYRRLVEANAEKNVEILSEVLDLLREFRDTWKEAMQLTKNPSKQAQ
jgi:flagellar protein FliS